MRPLVLLKVGLLIAIGSIITTSCQADYVSQTVTVQAPVKPGTQLDMTRIIYASELITHADAPFSRPPGNGETYVAYDITVERDDTTNDPRVIFSLTPARERVNTSVCQHGDPASLHNFTVEFPPGARQVSVSGPRWNVTSTDQYMMYMAACKIQTTIKADINTVWMNPFGHLSGSLLGNMLFSRALVIIYAIVIPIWLILAAIYRHHLLRLHALVAIVACFCLVDAAFAYWDYWHHNVYGQPSSILVALATLMTMMQQTAWPALCFTVALGYGISRPSLGIWRHRLMALLVIYFGAGTVQRGADRLGAKLLMAIAGGITFLLTLLLFVATCAAVYDTTIQLRARRQEVKLSLYRRVTALLVITALAVISFELYSFFAQQFSDRYLQRHWSLWWLHTGGFMQIVYLFDVLAVALIFRPSIDMSRYQYQQFADRQARGGDGEFEDLQLDSVEVELGLFDGKTETMPPTSSSRNRDLDASRNKAASAPSSSILDTDDDEIGDSLTIPRGLAPRQASVRQDATDDQSPYHDEGDGVGSSYYDGTAPKEGILDELVEELGLTPEHARRSRQGQPTEISDADLTEHY